MEACPAPGLSGFLGAQGQHRPVYVAPEIENGASPNSGFHTRSSLIPETVGERDSVGPGGAGRRSTRSPPRRERPATAHKARQDL
jgi:hypothetical protein